MNQSNDIQHINTQYNNKIWSNQAIDIKSFQNRLLKVCYVSATKDPSSKASFYFIFLWPLIVLMKQTRQARLCKYKLLYRTYKRTLEGGVEFA
jgi:hypothetical protein